ncbi:MAG: tRNA (adenosine(37)-N6)-dimethylallyltransferase MiaA [Acidimicrobiia bacterium]
MTDILAIVGPTASGKSRIAHRLALQLDAQVISADSMQVYRSMDIGTAKPTRLEREEVKYHLIDIVEPEETFTVADYQERGRAVLESLEQVIIVGGSGLHFRSLVDELRFPPHDPELRAGIEAMSTEEQRAELLRLDPGAGDHIDLANARRVIRALEIAMITGEVPSGRDSGGMRTYQSHFAFRAVGIDPGDRIAQRIDDRLDEMMAAGLMAEIGALAERMGRTASQAVGYRQLIPVLGGDSSLEEGLAATRRATLSLARQQRTFFRRDPRIAWLPWSDDEDARHRGVWSAFERVETS